jgi:hypothetical protein
MVVAVEAEEKLESFTIAIVFQTLLAVLMVVVGMALMGKLLMVLVVPFALFGPAQHVHSHQLVQAILKR